MPGIVGLSYRVYLLNGLMAQGFSAEEGIRDGRQEGRDASFANPSLTGRLEWARPGSGSAAPSGTAAARTRTRPRHRHASTTRWRWSRPTRATTPDPLFPGRGRQYQHRRRRGDQRRIRRPGRQPDRGRLRRGGLQRASGARSGIGTSGSMLSSGTSGTTPRPACRPAWSGTTPWPAGSPPSGLSYKPVYNVVVQGRLPAPAQQGRVGRRTSCSIWAWGISSSRG